MSNDKPATGLPYSPAYAANGLLFVSGQIPVDAAGNLVGESMIEQTEQVMNNLKAVLEANGSALDKVVKANVYLTDMSQFAAMNQVYASCFSGKLPARAAMGVTALAKGALVEIDAIALLD